MQFSFRLGRDSPGSPVTATTPIPKNAPREAKEPVPRVRPSNLAIQALSGWKGMSNFRPHILPICTFPENTELAATGQGVASADFSAPTGEHLQGQARIAEVNRPPAGPFACDRTEALIALRVRKSNFHVSYRTDPG